MKIWLAIMAAALAVVLSVQASDVDLELKEVLNLLDKAHQNDKREQLDNFLEKHDKEDPDVKELRELLEKAFPSQVSPPVNPPPAPSPPPNPNVGPVVTTVAKKRLLKFLDTMDKDGNDVKELRELLEKAFPSQVSPPVNPPPAPSPPPNPNVGPVVTTVAKKRLLKLLDTMDKDGNDVKELRELFEKAFPSQVSPPVNPPPAPAPPPNPNVGPVVTTVAKKRLLKLLDTMDKDGNDLKEIRELLEKAFPSQVSPPVNPPPAPSPPPNPNVGPVVTTVAKKRMLKLLDTMDKDGNDVKELRELLEKAFPSQVSPPVNPPPAPAPAPNPNVGPVVTTVAKKRLLRLLDTMDKDGNDIKELRELLEKAFPSQVSPPVNPPPAPAPAPNPNVGPVVTTVAKKRLLKLLETMDKDGNDMKELRELVEKAFPSQVSPPVNPPPAPSPPPNPNVGPVVTTVAKKRMQELLKLLMEKRK